MDVRDQSLSDSAASFGTTDHSRQPCFRTLGNVLATPHIGCRTEDLYRTFYGDAAASIGAWRSAKCRIPARNTR